MFKTIPIIVMAVLCLNFNSRAQSPKTLPLPTKQAISGQTNEIIIEGKIDSSIINRFNTKELLIKIHDPIKELNNEEELIKSTITDNGKRFKFVIKPSTNLTYISFWTYNRSKKNKLLLGDLIPITFPSRSGVGADEVYLFMAGDSINLNIHEKGIMSFSGKNSKRLNCQFQIYNLHRPSPSSVNFRRSDLIHNKRFETYLQLQNQELLYEQLIRLDLLKTYLGEFEKEAYQILRTNIQSYLDYRMLLTLPDIMQPYSILSVSQYYSKYLGSKSSVVGKL